MTTTAPALHPPTALEAPPRPGAHVTPVVDVAIVGLGYVGLPTALALHASGLRVLGLDSSLARLQTIQEDRADLMPEDRVALRSALDSQRLTLTDDVSALSAASCVIICVPTPVDRHLVPDLEPLRGACATVVAAAVPGQLVVLTSTTYPGTTQDLLVGPLAERGFRCGTDVFVAFSPERIDPGHTASGHVVPRVLGGVTPACAARASAVIESTGSPAHVVDSPETAEMTKLLENTFRAVNIAVANEFADACRSLGLQVMDVIEAASTKPYGFMPFRPGAGVGGHCIPCDPHYLLWQLREHHLATPVIEQAMAANARRPATVVHEATRLLAAVGRPLTGARVHVVGMTYKPGVEDVRESPALTIASMLLQQQAQVTYTDDRAPQVVLANGERLTHTAADDVGQVDLAIVHTWHPDSTLALLECAPLVLDTTFSVPTRRELHTL